LKRWYLLHSLSPPERILVNHKAMEGQDLPQPTYRQFEDDIEESLQIAIANE
jgi:hypothetical protein